MRNTSKIQTGVETPDRVDITLTSISPTVWSYADDGELATWWAVERLDETTVHVEIYRHDGDRTERDGVEQRAIDADETTAHWALACASTDPPTAIKAVIEFFGSASDDS